jgi:hypothetical protein
VIEFVKRAVQRRVTGDRSEQIALYTQVLDVRTALAATGDDERHLSDHLAAVVHRTAFTSGNDPGGEQMTKFQTIGKGV